MLVPCYVKFHVMKCNISCWKLCNQTWVLRIISNKITKSHVTKLDIKWHMKCNTKESTTIIWNFDWRFPESSQIINYCKTNWLHLNKYVQKLQMAIMLTFLSLHQQFYKKCEYIAMDTHSLHKQLFLQTVVRTQIWPLCRNDNYVRLDSRFEF